jgi:hypothetical protein
MRIKQWKSFSHTHTKTMKHKYKTQNHQLHGIMTTTIFFKMKSTITLHPSSCPSFHTTLIIHLSIDFTTLHLQTFIMLPSQRPWQFHMSLRHHIFSLGQEAPFLHSFSYLWSPSLDLFTFCELLVFLAYVF